MYIGYITYCVVGRGMGSVRIAHINFFSHFCEAWTCVFEMCEWTDIHDATVRNLAGGGANCRASLRDSRPISYMVFLPPCGIALGIVMLV